MGFPILVRWHLCIEPAPRRILINWTIPYHHTTEHNNAGKSSHIKPITYFFSVCPPTYFHHLKGCYRFYKDKIALETEEERQICARTPWLSPGHLITVNDPNELSMMQAITWRWVRSIKKLYCSKHRPAELSSFRWDLCTDKLSQPWISVGYTYSSVT